MSAAIFNGLAEVFEAGAETQAGLVMNHAAQLEVEKLRAMARKAREIAQRFEEES